MIPQLNRYLISTSIAALALVAVASAVNMPDDFQLKRGLNAVPVSALVGETPRPSGGRKLTDRKRKPDEILRSMIERYSTITTYQSTGAAAESAEPGESKSSKIKETSFELSFTRPNFVRLQWPEPVFTNGSVGPTADERTRYVLLGNNDGVRLLTHVSFDDKEGRFKPYSFPDIITGLRVAYVSGNSVSTNLVAELLVGDTETVQTLLQLKNIKLREEMFEGEKCYLITGTSERANPDKYVHRLWINESNMLISKYEIRLKTEKGEMVTEEIHRKLAVNQTIPQEIYQPDKP